MAVEGVRQGVDTDNDGIVDAFDADSQANLLAKLGHFILGASHTAIFNTQMIAESGGVITGDGATATNTVTSTVTAAVGDDAEVDARTILVEALGFARKPDLGDDGNAKSTSGAVVGGARVDSDTTINMTTVVQVGEDAVLAAALQPR